MNGRRACALALRAAAAAAAATRTTKVCSLGVGFGRGFAVAGGGGGGGRGGRAMGGGGGGGGRGRATTSPSSAAWARAATATARRRPPPPGGRVRRRLPRASAASSSSSTTAAMARAGTADLAAAVDGGARRTEGFDPPSPSSISGSSFEGEVLSFLDESGAPWRRFDPSELREVALRRSRNNGDPRIITRGRAEEIAELMEDRTLLAVGRGAGGNAAIEANSSAGSPYSFLLHLCPTETYSTESVDAKTVMSRAWLNAHLTDAFYDHIGPANKINDGNGRLSADAKKPSTIIVHLHEDVWNRSPAIVRSRLLSKCGVVDRRIYARKTVARRVGKSEYLPFLETNHLWAATSAKFGYGLFCKESGQLVAAATFTHGRKVTRSSREFRSYKLLRFCTALDTAVVGGLTKLISAFVKDAKRKHPGVPMDVITAVDRDFGGSTWPKFESMGRAMDPIPMFVGEVDGLRRHAVGAGITPVDHRSDADEIASMTASTLLRSGLPDSLLDELQRTDARAEDDADRPWKLAARRGFHPVFDAGVERLMLVIDDDDDGATTGSPSTSELWESCSPRYATEHYSSNAGVEKMLDCVRRAKEIYKE
ncbi:hypothetical protein ACHAWF_017743 [Thalassiosira exigua]